MNSLDKLQQNLAYQFQNIDLLTQALTHRSYLNENRNLKQSNERLEYLGDAVLELITSDFLFHQFPDLPEGELTSIRAKIVQTKSLAHVASQLKLGDYLMMSKGEIATGGKQNTSILADLLESIIGAIYLDGAIKPAKSFITHHILSHYQQIILKAQVEDYKSTLQEYVQSQGDIAPTYQVIDEKGPDHHKNFTIQVNYFSQPRETGSGPSKQIAQQLAAKNALEKLNIIK